MGDVRSVLFFVYYILLRQHTKICLHSLRSCQLTRGRNWSELNFWNPFCHIWSFSDTDPNHQKCLEILQASRGYRNRTRSQRLSFVSSFAGKWNTWCFYHSYLKSRLLEKCRSLLLTLRSLCQEINIGAHKNVRVYVYIRLHVCAEQRSFISELAKQSLHLDCVASGGKCLLPRDLFSFYFLPFWWPHPSTICVSVHVQYLVCYLN